MPEQRYLGFLFQAAVAANGNGNVFDVKGYDYVCVQTAGTFDATINFEATVDESNWESMQGNLVGAVGVATSATTTDIWRFDVRGISQLRFPVASYVSGNVTVTGLAVKTGIL